VRRRLTYIFVTVPVALKIRAFRGQGRDEAAGQPMRSLMDQRPGIPTSEARAVPGLTSSASGSLVSQTLSNGKTIWTNNMDDAPSIADGAQCRVSLRAFDSCTQMVAIETSDVSFMRIPV
jgi:hypothetical protein